MNIKKRIEQITNENIKYNKHTSIHNSSLPAKDLKELQIITDTKTKFHRITYSSNNKFLAKCDYMEFINENVGYISDVDVDVSIQKNKIGTKIREYAINDLNVDVIYSYPTNDVIKYICKKQGFEPSEINKKWYVKK